MGEMLKFPPLLPSSSECNWRFSKCHAETPGPFSSELFLWLLAWGDMLASHAPRPQRLFPALRGSGIPFCPLPVLRLSPGHAGSPGGQLHSPSGGAPWGLVGALWDCDQVAEHQLPRGQRGCSPNVTCLPASVCSVQTGVVQAEQDWTSQKANAVLASVAGKPAELSQLLPSTLRSDSAPHGCQAAVLQARAGPEHGIGSKSLICTNFFSHPPVWSSAHPWWRADVFLTPCFHKSDMQRDGQCPAKPGAAASQGWEWAERHPHGSLPVAPAADIWALQAWHYM